MDALAAALASFAHAVEMKLAAAQRRYWQLQRTRDEVAASLDRAGLSAAFVTGPGLRRIAALELEASAVRLDIERLQQELRLARGKRDRLQDRARSLTMAQERRKLLEEALEAAQSASWKATDKQDMVD